MNQYLVMFRPDAGKDFADALSITAHRVEGWNRDYAFFGHETFLDEVTRLVPRDLVQEVVLESCARDEV